MSQNASPTPATATRISYQRGRNADIRSTLLSLRVSRVDTRMHSAMTTSSTEAADVIGSGFSQSLAQAFSRKCSVYAAHANCQARKYGCRLCSCR